jgi:hypothetical protein
MSPGLVSANCTPASISLNPFCTFCNEAHARGANQYQRDASSVQQKHSAHAQQYLIEKCNTALQYISRRANICALLTAKVKSIAFKISVHIAPAVYSVLLSRGRSKSAAVPG